MGRRDEGIHLAEILSNTSPGLRLQLLGRLHRLQVRFKRGQLVLYLQQPQLPLRRSSLLPG